MLDCGGSTHRPYPAGARRMPALSALPGIPKSPESVSYSWLGCPFCQVVFAQETANVFQRASQTSPRPRPGRVRKDRKPWLYIELTYRAREFTRGKVYRPVIHLFFSPPARVTYVRQIRKLSKNLREFSASVFYVHHAATCLPQTLGAHATGRCQPHVPDAWLRRYSIAASKMSMRSKALPSTMLQ